MPAYSVVGVNSAAQLMMAQVLMEEMKDTCVRINQAIFRFVNTRARAAYAKPEWITAEEVGRVLAYLASDQASMVNAAVLRIGDKPRGTVAI